MSISNSHKIKSKREVIVVLKSGVGPLDTEGLAQPATEPDAGKLSELLSEHGARIRSVSPQVPSPSFETPSAAISREARHRVERYHSVSAPDERIDALVTSLRAHPAVESVYIKPPAEPPEVKPRQPAPSSPGSAPPARIATPDFTGRQVYLGPAPVGIDARYAWTLPGGRGTGVRIIDCEWAWNFDHEDLSTHCSGNVVGTTQASDDNHGTSVAGVLIANDNNVGAIGVAPDSTLATAAFDDSSDQATSAIIMQAADHLSGGDILLLEIHRPGPNAADPPNGQEGFIAIEWWPDDFAAIAYATSKGILVIEAGGNGSENLDDPLYNTPGHGFPADWKNPFAVTGPDSGAIVVGAGNPPAGTHSRNQDTYEFNETYVDRARCSFSNYGSRIDCQGWGWEVTTLGGGDLQPDTANIQPSDHNYLYTDVFAGTSSASPIITGTVACLQGMLRATGRPLLSPKAARRLLRSTGSPQQPAPGRPVSQRIGTRPDLKALCAAATSMVSSPMVTNPGTIPDARQRLNIVVDFIPVGNSNRPGTPLKPLQITIHNTDNSDAGADAHAHAIYQQGPDARLRQVSWHFTVDDHSVYQSLPVNEVGWHAGTHQGNYSTIGIEICENDGIDQQAANDRAALLTAVQLHELGISLQGNVVQHFHWSGKNCPALLRNPPSNWGDFLAKVAYYYDQIQLDSPDVDHRAQVNPSPTYPSARISNTPRYRSSASLPNITAMSPSFPSENQAGVQRRIYSTEFGGGSDYPQESAYSGIVDPDQPQAALPAKLPSSTRHILVTNSANGRSVYCLVNDRGPWNLNDAYWADNRRPATEYQMENGIPAENGSVPTNPAGIDLTPAAMQALGVMGPINSRSALVNWQFAQDGAT
jgi:Subtilase family/N-acetylmuramoyl-L-alanine amidase